MFGDINWGKVGENVLDLAKVATAGTPVGAGLAILDAIVDDNVKDTGVDNNEVIEYLEVLKKSSHNDLDDKGLCMIKAYLGCENNS